MEKGEKEEGAKGLYGVSLEEPDLFDGGKVKWSYTCDVIAAQRYGK